ncbi:MAG: uroporphyrinogen-III decarboxylase [Peptococcaceae bacterium]|nr:uroporphyrinogen-III decarboxylase [Peptococcaceae bacterium]
MKSNQELLKERVERVHKAIALEKPDKTPVVLLADAFCATHMGVKLSDFCSSLQYSNKVMVESIKDLGDLEGFDSAFVAANLFPLSLMTRIKLPGRELKENTLWQLDERELMTRDDYDTILNKGWKPFMEDYVKNRLNMDLDLILGELADTPQMVKNFEDAGYYVYSPLVINLVTERISGGRSMQKFIKDMYSIPDKVEAVIDVIQKETLDELRQQIRATNSKVVFISPARGASEFYSRKLWERFIFKYLKEVADAILEEGAVVNFHIDSNWERDLEYFRVFPKGRCVFETDGVTDIYKIKEVLGDRMCIKGDVPAAMLTLGTPDDVYNYCTKLIKDMGPGFILSSGCAVPVNAKVENVKAMIAAASGK